MQRTGTGGQSGFSVASQEFRGTNFITIATIKRALLVPPSQLGNYFEFPREDVMPSFDGTPDLPERFGYKISWFAVRAPSPAAVIDALELDGATPANWTSGLAAAYERSPESDCWLFVSPPISGWVLAASFSLPYPTVETHHSIGVKFTTMFARLMSHFDDVQFFGSYRVCGFAAWARALGGKPVRVFSYSDGEVLMNFGKQTPEEAKRRLPDLGGLSPSDACDAIFRIAEEQNEQEEALVAGGLSRDEARARVRERGCDPIPNEDDVVELAGLWSVDPSQLLDQDDPAGLGLAVRLPENLRQ